MLHGKNIRLRAVKEDDLAELYKYFNTIWMKGEYMLRELLSEYQFRLKFSETGFWSEERGTLVLCYQEKMIGAIWFEKQMFLDCLDLNYYIFQEKDRGNEWMKEGLELFCKYLFATKKVERLQISVPGYNRAALRVAQKCGFSFEGIARSARFFQGKYLDLCLYSLLRSEYCPVEKIPTNL